MASDKVVEVTTLTQLHEIFNNHEKVVVDFHAPSWCIPCRRLSPHIDSVAAAKPDIRFVKVDIEKADEGINNTFKIQSVPTVLLFENGEQTREIKARVAPQIATELDS